jgi:hypothetical protein
MSVIPKRRLPLRKNTIYDGPAASVAEAARIYSVNEWKLRARLKGVELLSARPIQGKTLHDEWESGLLLHMKKTDDIGFPVQRETNAANANLILAQNHADAAIQPLVVGTKWASRFLKRHSEDGFVIRIQESLDIACYHANKPEVISIYFQKLKQALEKYGIQLPNIYNMDKTGFRIGVGGKKKIATQHAHRRAFAPSSTNRDYVTVVECVSADRSVIPPMVILPGKTLMEAWGNKTRLA